MREAQVIPERNFLRAALPAVLSDPKVALVKTGHGFINLPPRLSQATSTLIEASEPKSCVVPGPPEWGPRALSLTLDWQGLALGVHPAPVGAARDRRPPRAQLAAGRACRGAPPRQGVRRR